MTSHLQPEIRIDRNGKAVTKHVNPNTPLDGKSSRTLPAPQAQNGLDKMQDASEVIAAAKEYGSEAKDLLESVGKLTGNGILSQVAEVFGNANNIAGLGVLLSAKSAKDKIDTTIKAYKKFNEEKDIVQNNGSERNERNFRDAEILFTEAARDLSKEITDNISAISEALGSTVGAAGALPAQIAKIAPLITSIALGRHTKKLLPQGTGIIRDLYKVRTEDIMAGHEIFKGWQREIADTRLKMANSDVGRLENVEREIAYTRIIREYGEKLGKSSEEITNDINQEINDVALSFVDVYNANNEQYRDTMGELR